MCHLYTGAEWEVFEVGGWTKDKGHHQELLQRDIDPHPPQYFRLRVRTSQTAQTHTHTLQQCVCWCSSEKDTLVEANKKNQQSNPAVQPAALISKVPQPEPQTHILSSDFCQSPLSSQQAWMSYFTDSGHGVSSVLRNNCPVKWAAGCEAELGGWLETKMMLGESSMRAAR